MNDKHVKYLLNFFKTYEIASAIDTETLIRALKMSPTNGDGITKILKVNPAYFSHECSRKIPKELKATIKITTGSWIFAILRYLDVCPVCGGMKKSLQSVTCSVSCSNKHNPRKVDFSTSKNYRTICFAWHDKKCVICNESNIVEVHHYDENHLNNEPSNLVPLCPTHHQYWHSSFKYLIEEQVIEYVKQSNTDF